MYKQNFGKVNQIRFSNESEYYELLGFLAKNDNSTNLAWEDNDVKGTAWGKEGRIEFFRMPQNLNCYLKQTAGNGGSIISRVNCNEFVQNIRNNHGFVMGKIQNIANVTATIPQPFIADFNRGQNL